MKRRHVIILAVLLACPFYLGVAWVREYLAVDAALDSGATWDYVAERADYTASHPYVPFGERHHTLFVVSGWSMLGAVVYLAAVSLGRRRTHPA